uniref:Uncharacterized protein n=1 Tax=Ditylenchus dipsaci TaxID=166011 RepID=A0A915DNG3_9BILA
MILCSFSQANPFYAPYSSLPYASRMQLLQRQIRVPSSETGKTHAHPQQPEQPLELAVVVDPVTKRERPFGNSYGWEQCEFSP